MCIRDRQLTDLKYTETKTNVIEFSEIMQVVDATVTIKWKTEIHSFTSSKLFQLAHINNTECYILTYQKCINMKRTLEVLITFLIKEHKILGFLI